jgi:demethylmenaquinone methyltransferase/2-methoxy-6-polyprenyl-1,4-benzoquinol methylase
MTSRLYKALATPDGKRRYVRALFATIADRYDFITVALSYGQDQRWKRRVIALAEPRPGLRVLDLATGTGDLAFAAAARGARVVGLDITYRMIELARRKVARPFSASARDQVPRATADAPKREEREGGQGRDRAPERGALRFMVGDMLALPFPAASFDIVTTGYGLRNVPDLPQAIEEIRRVLAPGGQAVSLDFNRPASAWIRSAYLAYLTVVGATLGWVLHRDPDTYRYIPASIRHYPGAAAVARMFEDRGFSRVRHYRVLGGLMAIHHATRD